MKCNSIGNLFAVKAVAKNRMSDESDFTKEIDVLREMVSGTAQNLIK